MNKKEMIRCYLRALESCSSEEVLKYFSPEAVIKSPLNGMVKASEFFPSLFSLTLKAKVHISNIFMSVENANSGAVHFRFDWDFLDGGQAQFDCVDIFELDPKLAKISKMTIVYDSYFIRKAFEKVKIAAAYQTTRGKKGEGEW